MQKLFIYCLLSYDTGKQAQTVVTKPANSKCALVMLYVLFEPVSFFELAVFPSLSGWDTDWSRDPLVGAADEVSRVCAACMMIMSCSTPRGCEGSTPLLF
jgi:hypothetical protein